MAVPQGVQDESSTRFHTSQESDTYGLTLLLKREWFTIETTCRHIRKLQPTANCDVSATLFAKYKALKSQFQGKISSRIQPPRPNRTAETA